MPKKIFFTLVGLFYLDVKPSLKPGMSQFNKFLFTPWLGHGYMKHIELIVFLFIEKCIPSTSVSID